MCRARCTAGADTAGLTTRRVALLCLLETALSPFLVYFIVGEKPTGQTIAAAVLIIAVLSIHALYDMHLERTRAATSQREEGQELLGAPAEAHADSVLFLDEPPSAAAATSS